MQSIENYRYDILRDDQEKLVTFHKTDDLAPHENQHFHDSIEFIYVAKGCIHAKLGSDSLEITSGHLLALPSFTPHDCPRKDAELWQLIVPRSMISNLDKLMERKTFASRVIRDPNGQLLSYLKLIHEINTREGIFSELDEDCAKNSAVTAAASFIRTVIPLFGLRDEIGSSSSVMQAIRYLSEHFREPLRIGEISQKLYCNRSQLSAHFRETFGLSMNEYVARLRAAEVRRLLSERSYITLSEACVESGFGSLRTLHRTYKAIYGCAPHGRE